MAAYTPSLRLTLPVTGTDDGTWGDTVNNGITSLTDAAIAGTATVIQGNVANYTLTSNSGATDEARNMFLNITGALTAARNVICPTASKLYFMKNSTTGGFAVTLKTAAGTGISVPAGSITALYCDGTNVVDAITYANIPVINATTVDTTNLDVTNIKAKDGTASITMADTTGIATFSKATVISTSDATNAALRITQTGAGNAFVVEDSTSPDATPFLIDAAGRVIAGYTALVAPDVNGPTIFPQMNVVGVTSTAQYAAFSYINAAANAPIVALSKSRGATIGTNTIVVSGDTIGIVKFTAADGTAFVPAASISAQVDGTPGLNDMPGRLVFNTTADGAATSTERMRIDSAGNVGIGTITPSSELHVARNDATSYDGAATDGQLAAGSTVFIQQTAGTNTGVAQIVFQPRSTFPYNRIVSSGGSAPFMTFVTNNAERLRIDSAGNLGIGTTSMSTKLDVVGTPAATSGGLVAIYDTSATGLNSTLGSLFWASGPGADFYIGKKTEGATGSLSFGESNNGTEFMRLNDVGNLGLGVTPSAWSGTAFQVKNAAVYSYNGQDFRAQQNIYFDGANYRYITANPGSFMLQYQNSYSWHISYGTPSAGGVATLTQAMTLDASGNLLVGVTSSAVHTIAKGTVQGTYLLNVSGLNDGSAQFYSSSTGSFNAAAASFKVNANSTTGRSINSAGTNNASGADYAEYMTKASDFTVAKGDVVGINAQGKLTNVFVDAVSFVVKSTDPSYVGGDTWGSELEGEALEAARQTVDRIAFAGQIPVNVTGATPGQYIVPVNDNGAIKGEAVSNPTFEQYQQSVGKVIAIEQDGRARIIVKVA